MDSKTIAQNIATRLQLSKPEADAMINGLTKIISTRCSDLDSIALPGFGTFEPKKRQERITVHPSNGKRMLVPPKIILTFKPSGSLKQRCKNAKSSDNLNPTIEQ